MGPLAQSDGHDAPRLVDELVPCRTTMVDEIVVGFEDAVGEPVVAHELPDVLDRVELWALRRQHNGGSTMMVMLAGTRRRVDKCQPAWSTRRMAWAAGATVAAISARCKFIASVLQAGMIRAATLPSFGQTGPKTQAEQVRW